MRETARAPANAPQSADGLGPRMCQKKWPRGPGRVILTSETAVDSGPGCHLSGWSELGDAFPSAQTRTYLSPDEVLKGLQGETVEALSGVSLSVSVLKELYRAYEFCCTNMKLFFKVRSAL